LRQEKESAPLLSRPFPALLFALAAVLAASAALLAWRRAANDRARLVTGGARWIWYAVDLPESAPLRFRASREFRLDSIPASAKAKLFVDPRGSLTVNSTAFPAVEQRPGSPLRVLDLAPALVAGANRIAIDAESPTGAGGILFALELPGGRSVVSDSAWQVALLDGSRAGESRPAAVWGRPPMYPWGYPPQTVKR
jgi:hypothetical protein